MDQEKTRKREPLPPWLSRQERPADNLLDEATGCKREKLIQCINYNHFQGKPLFVFLRHKSYEEGILLKAYPSPGMGEELVCQWERSLESHELDDYSISCLIVTFRESIIIVEVEPLEATPGSLTVRLGKGYYLSRRQGQRFSSLGVSAEFTQHAFLTKGDLVDFSARSFQVRVKLEDSSSVRSLNPEENVSLRLFARGNLVFSGECRLIRQNNDHLAVYLVFSSQHEQIKRFPAKRIRNPRKEIKPPLVVQFIHPLTETNIYREISDISVSGFSLQESQEEETLMPGLILPQVQIIYGGMIRMKCAAQVIFRRKQGDQIIFGLSILDMAIRDFSALTHLISINTDSHACVSTELDMDELWEFLFDTDFIYPEKYKLLQGSREMLKETYRKVYQDNLELSRHFTYEKNGSIYAHIAMIRAYERAWMIHHFAARPLENRLTGFIVLKALLIFINGFHRLPSANMDYVMTYYRPHNRIITRIFGGFAEHVKDLRACSQDLFSYFLLTKGEGEGEGEGTLPPWTIRESTAGDLKKLEHFYNNISGGLLLEALSLRKANEKSSSLEAAYREAGLLRRCRVHTLCHSGKPIAFLILDHAEPGINLSELLNCVKVIVLEPDQLPWEVLSGVIAEFSSGYPLPKLPVMIYPARYAELAGLPAGKNYQLWILNTAYGGPYLEYMERKVKIRLG
ncbi:MAG: PilZ domain-containing protein [Smithellaceae bacterium]|nr:PilZ domain-containing protein [Smithellaceae bacterium]